MEGLRISALFQVTDLDQVGASGEEVTEDQVGSPERLHMLREGISPQISGAICT